MSRSLLPSVILLLAAGCSSSDSSASVAMAPADATPDGSPQPSTGVSDAGADASTPSAGGLGAKGTLTFVGAVGPEGGSPIPFNVSKLLSGAVKLSSAAQVEIACGEILLRFGSTVEASLQLELRDCGPTETVALSFNVPLRSGEFPGAGAKFPTPIVQLYQANGSNHYVSKGAAGYGSILSNEGVTLAVSNVVSKAKTIDLSARLKGALKGGVTCAGCASGGPTVTFDLQVDLTNVPRPDA